MAKYYLLVKDAVFYRTDAVFYHTQSRFLRDVCVKFKGYAYQGSSHSSLMGRKTLPFKLSKDERDKYRVALRLMR